MPIQIASEPHVLRIEIPFLHLVARRGGSHGNEGCWHNVHIGNSSGEYGVRAEDTMGGHGRLPERDDNKKEHG